MIDSNPPLASQGTERQRRPHVKFSEDWDKLSAPTFTTIRGYRPEKEAYYSGQIGREFTILRVRNYWSYMGRRIGSATLTGVRVVVPREMPAGDLQADVMKGGKPDQVWLDRLLVMDRALCLTFENHTGILGDLGGRHG